MRGRLVVVLISLTLTTSLFGKEVFLSISGKANNFFTDARIFNPSFTKTITVNAQYLPGNNNNSSAPTVQLSIPPRAMKIYDDAVQAIFGGGPALGAIRLTSDDDFVASQRIYRDARGDKQQGTLGQLVPGLDVSAARAKGVLLLLKSGQASLGAFRTNWGGANPNATTAATVTLKLYDKNNALVGTKTETIQPYGIVAPRNIVGDFGNPSSDLTDAWISYESNVPVFIYCSVVDNGSEDPTFVPAAEDSGVPPPVQPTSKTVTVTAVNWSFAISSSDVIKAGDEVKFIMKSNDGVHGFRLFSPTGQVLIDIDPLGAASVERTITMTAPGSYVYVCTRPICGEGHNDMNGTITVGAPSDPDDRY